jgi:hypothetical protein
MSEQMTTRSRKSQGRRKGQKPPPKTDDEPQVSSVLNNPDNTSPSQDDPNVSLGRVPELVQDVHVDQQDVPQVHGVLQDVPADSLSQGFDALLTGIFQQPFVAEPQEEEIFFQDENTKITTWVSQPLLTEQDMPADDRDASQGAPHDILLNIIQCALFDVSGIHPVLEDHDKRAIADLWTHHGIDSWKDLCRLTINAADVHKMESDMELAVLKNFKTECPRSHHALSLTAMLIASAPRYVARQWQLIQDGGSNEPIEEFRLFSDASFNQKWVNALGSLDIVIQQYEIEELLTGQFRDRTMTQDNMKTWRETQLMFNHWVAYQHLGDKDHDPIMAFAASLKCYREMKEGTRPVGKTITVSAPSPATVVKTTSPSSSVTHTVVIPPKDSLHSSPTGMVQGNLTSVQNSANTVHTNVASTQKSTHMSRNVFSKVFDAVKSAVTLPTQGSHPIKQVTSPVFNASNPVVQATLNPPKATSHDVVVSTPPASVPSQTTAKDKTAIDQSVVRKRQPNLAAPHIPPPGILTHFHGYYAIRSEGPRWFSYIKPLVPVELPSNVSTSALHWMHRVFPDGSIMVGVSDKGEMMYSRPGDSNYQSSYDYAVQKAKVEQIKVVIGENVTPSVTPMAIPSNTSASLPQSSDLNTMIRHTSLIDTPDTNQSRSVHFDDASPGNRQGIYQPVTRNVGMSDQRDYHLRVDTSS